MKHTLILFLAFFTVSTFGQNVLKSKKYKISFETTEVLKKYKTESNLVLGYDNENYAVDIELILNQNESSYFPKGAKEASMNLAKKLGFKNVVDGGESPFIKNSFYVISRDSDAAVYVLALVNNRLKIAYEITVYCYNKNVLEGEKIIKSFKFLK